jgi:predicted amino acid racemase
MYPRLTIDTHKIEENSRWVCDRARRAGIDVTGIVKNACGLPAVAEAMLKGGATAVGDARIQNLQGLAGLSCEKWLIRMPMISEADTVVRYADLSLNSEIEAVLALNAAAVSIGKRHGVILMTDLGDLREGYFEAEDLYQNVEKILSLPAVDFRGIGANLSCTGAIVPTVATYEKFEALSQGITQRFGVPCAIMSGGASSTFFMIQDGTIPGCINNLRIGELILYGTDVSNHLVYPELHHDAFVLEAEIIEVKDKPSMPIGRIGRDAFGNIPVFEDKGIRRRAICALGKQDTDPEGLFPMDEGVEIVAASSDHLIVDLSDARETFRTGDLLRFRPNYVSGLHANTSPYIEKVLL